MNSVIDEKSVISIFYWKNVWAATYMESSTLLGFYIELSSILMLDRSLSGMTYAKIKILSKMSYPVMPSKKPFEIWYTCNTRWPQSLFTFPCFYYEHK